MSTVRLEKIDKGHYRVIGDMTFDTVNDLCKHKKNLPIENGDHLLIDLGEVGRADSAGVACLLEFIRHAKAKDKDISFENIPSQLQALIRVSGLEKLVHI